MPTEQLQASIEAVLFMNHKPVSLAKLQEIINPELDMEEYRTAISNLQSLFASEDRGIEVVEVANGFQFRTKPDYKEIIQRMYQAAPTKLTNAMLEVLAITAYNQPVTREQIDKVRGVDSSHLMRALLDKKMLRIAGKSEEVGRPMLYATTKEFLELFGLRDLNALPSLREIEEMLPKNEVGAEYSEEEVLAREMEGIVADSSPLEFNDLELEEYAQAQTQPAGSNSDSSATLDNATENREAAGDLVQPSEAARNLPFGPEGTA
jgi:segregation and condensation protein B